ncbi:MAG: tetratricopeptide repeat protein [Rikenellaceae bacterium]
MTNKHNEQSPEIEETLGEAMTKTEQFFENNGKKLLYAIFGLLVIAACVFGYKLLVVEPKLEKAAEMIVNAQIIFEQQNPDYKAALEGNENGAGFLEVIESCGSTPAGNLANHYAGICYLKLGDFDNALKYLSAYDAVKGVPSVIVNAQNKGLQGDIAVEQGDYKKAISLYAQAVSVSKNNNLTAPAYLYKGGLAAMAVGNAEAAKVLFETIVLDFPTSVLARDASKYVGALNVK